MRILNKEEFKLELEEFLEQIKKGSVFVYPTDTIYGIGANALNKAAVEKIRKLNPTLKGLSLKEAATDIFEVPYHRGAIRAFKEKGLWTDQLEKWHQGFFK